MASMIRRFYILPLNPGVPDAKVQEMIAALSAADRFIPGLLDSSAGVDFDSRTVLWENTFVDEASYSGPYMVHPYHIGAIDNYVMPDSPECITDNTYATRYTTPDATQEVRGGIRRVLLLNASTEADASAIEALAAQPQDMAASVFGADDVGWVSAKGRAWTHFTDLSVRQGHPRPTIKALPAAGPTPMLTPEQLQLGLEIAALFAAGAFGWWVKHKQEKLQTAPVNTFPPLVDEGDMHTPENVRYLSGEWRLGPDEALVVDFDPSGGADYWAWVLLNHWGETVDWRTRTAVINGENAVRRDDGTVRLVVAHEDPGLPNWLDTASHPAGSLSLRWFRSSAPLPTAQTQVVPFTQLPDS